jgi:FkbM family methyltransferase
MSSQVPAVMPSLAAWRPWQLILLGAVFSLLGREAVHVASGRYLARAASTPEGLAHCPLPQECSVGPADVQQPPQQQQSQQPPNYLKFPPGVKRLIINVGSNLQPPVPKDEDTAVIAVEPMLDTASRIPKHPRVFVVTAAVSSAVSIASFFSYNFNGESSSLSQMKDEDKGKATSWWADDKARQEGYAPVSFVPVITLRMILDAIPPEMDILLLKTDMQGYDFTAVSAAGSEALARIRQVYNEVNCHGFAWNPSAPLNDFDAVWADYMASRGFKLDENLRCPPQPCESNALWTRAGETPPPGLWWE